VLRSLSVLLGIATLAPVYALGARLFSRRAGVLAAAFLAVHAFHIQFSQEARSYALATLLLALSTWLLVISVQSTKRSPLVLTGYVLTSALACYSHLLSVLVLMAQWLWLLTAYGWRGVWNRIGTAVALAAAVAPAVVYMLTQDNGQIDWIPVLHRYNFLKGLAAAAGGHVYVLLLYMAIGALALFLGFKHRREDSSKGLWLLLFWIVVPLALLTLVSVTAKPMFVDRYLLMSVPALALLAAFAVDRSLHEGPVLKVAGLALGVLLLALSAAMSFRDYRSTVDQPNAFRELAQYMVSSYQPGDVALIFTAATLFPYEYYVTLGSGTAPKPVIPDYKGLPTGAQPIPTRAEVKTALAGHDRVWVVLNRAAIRLVPGAKEALPDIQATVNEEFTRAEAHEIDFLRVELYERKKPDSPGT
jgi:mannosyltransferase